MSAEQKKKIRSMFEETRARLKAKGTPHDPRTVKLFRLVRAADTVLGYFDWDGDQGDILQSELDMLYAALDSAPRGGHTN